MTAKLTIKYKGADMMRPPWRDAMLLPSLRAASFTQAVRMAEHITRVRVALQLRSGYDHRMMTYALAPMTMQGLPARIAAKLRVDPITGCWIWLGSIEHHGYGRVHWRGAKHYAHRVVWLLLRGRVPRELDHRCAIRACCNPRHLRPATRSENVSRSRWARERNAAGHWTAT